MASIDDELLLDAEEDLRAVEYISTHLPEELKSYFTEEQLYYILDVICDYYAETGVLDTAVADADGYVDICLEDVALYIQKKAAKESIGNFGIDELVQVVQAEMDFAESEAE